MTLNHESVHDEVIPYTSETVQNENDIDEEIEAYSIAGPQFDFVITNTHTPKSEPKPEITPQKPSKQNPSC